MRKGMRRRPPLGIASFRPGLQFLRSGILILLLASFLLTMLYIDFTDDKMQAPVLEMVENVASGLEDEQDSQAMPEEEQPDGTESVSAGSKPGSDVQDGGRVPEVLNIQPFHGPARGGIEVTIHGRHFMGHGEWATSAFIGSKRCLTAEVLDLGTLVCGLPPGVGGGLNAGVEKTVDGKVLASHNNTLFSYDAPLVERLSPDHSPASGGITVTVLGTNFGQPSDDGAENQQPVVLIGDSKCTGVRAVSDNELTCTTPPGSGGPTTVQVSFGQGRCFFRFLSGISKGPHLVESHRSRNQFAYVLSPREKIQQESSTLLDGLSVRHDSLPVFMHKNALSGLNELLHKDKFTGRTISFSATPDLLQVLPEDDTRNKYSKCALVLNSLKLLDTSFGADIDGADAVLRFNDSPTSGFKNEVGSQTHYRFVQMPLLRSMLKRTDTETAKRAWRPPPHEKLVMLSEYAQDLVLVLHKAYPHSEVLLPSPALLGNIYTLYGELHRRFIDLGIDEEFMRTQGYAHERRELLQSAVSMARLAQLAQQQNELGNHEAPTGASQPPQTLVAILIAVQMCKHVDIYGFDSVSAAPSKGLSYYSKDPAGLTVHDISTTRPEAIETMAAGVDNAIVELLEVVGHVKLVRNL